MSLDVTICSKCGQKKLEAKPGSLTQWISVCQCNMVASDQSSTIQLCIRCGNRLEKSQAGSLTQWIFRSKVCDCDFPEPVLAVPNPTVDESNEEEEEEEEEYSADDENVEVDADRFPVERFKPLKILGAGGNGTVYLCWDRHLRRKVAVKLLLDATRDALVMFQREAVATAKFRHTNAINIIDFGVNNDSAPYMVLEYFHGGTLSDYLAERGVPDVHTAVEFFIQIADALAHAHDANVFHRDIKCSNILVTEIDGVSKTKVIDFGIAAMMSDQDSTSFQGKTLVGTPRYMSPDQVNGLRFDARSEIYSLGCLMFEVLTGSVPFEGIDALELISKHVTEPVPAMRDGYQGEPPPPALEALVRRCLEKDPNDRFPDMHALKSSLIAIELDYSAVKHEELFDGSDSTPMVEPAKTTLSTKFGVIATTICAVVLGWCVISLMRSQSHEVSPAQQTRTFRKIQGETFDKATASLDEAPPEVVFRRIRYEGSPGNLMAHTPNDMEVDEALKFLRGRKDIRQLNLSKSGTDGSGLRYVTDLPINYIDLNLTDVEDAGFVHMEKMPNLAIIHLDRCKKVTDAALIHLVKLPLIGLNISGTSITDRGLETLSHIKSLEWLDLGDENITYEGIRTLKRLPKLRSLKVYFKKAPDIEFFKAMQELKLKTLSVYAAKGSRLSDECVECLTTTPQVELDNFKLSPKQLTEFASAQKVKRLVLSASGLYDAKLLTLRVRPLSHVVAERQSS